MQSFVTTLLFVWMTLLVVPGTTAVASADEEQQHEPNQPQLRNRARGQHHRDLSLFRRQAGGGSMTPFQESTSPFRYQVRQQAGHAGKGRKGKGGKGKGKGKGDDIVCENVDSREIQQDLQEDGEINMCVGIGKGVCGEIRVLYEDGDECDEDDEQPITVPVACPNGLTRLEEGGPCLCCDGTNPGPGGSCSEPPPPPPPPSPCREDQVLVDGICICPENQAEVEGTCVACEGDLVPNMERTACECPIAGQIQQDSTCSCPGDLVPNTDETSCVCPVESQTQDDDTCTCPADSIFDAQAISCDACPGDLVPNSEQTDCVCPVESQTQDDDTCTCPADSVFDAQAISCDACPGDLVPNSEQTDCVCPAADQTQDGNTCTCPAGSIFDETDGTCESCAENEIVLDGSCIGCQGDTVPNDTQDECVCPNNELERPGNKCGCPPGFRNSGTSCFCPPGFEATNLFTCCVGAVGDTDGTCCPDNASYNGDTGNCECDNNFEEGIDSENDDVICTCPGTINGGGNCVITGGGGGRGIEEGEEEMGRDGSSSSPCSSPYTQPSTNGSGCECIPGAMASTSSSSADCQCIPGYVLNSLGNQCVRKQPHSTTMGRTPLYESLP